jgi:hypothetical protein
MQDKPLVIEFTLDNIEPFSINAAHYHHRKVKTKECNDWIRRLRAQLSPVSKSQAWLSLMARSSAPIRLSLLFMQPMTAFKTRSGEINIRTKDLSNIEKLVIDVLFDKAQRYCNEYYTGLPIDDKWIVELFSSKRAISGTSYKLKVKIEVLDNTYLDELQEPH